MPWPPMPRQAYDSGIPAASRPSANLAMNGAWNGQALIASVMVRPGSLRNSRWAARRAGVRMPACTIEAIRIRSAQNDCG